jgi:hypothetical protein
MTETLTELPEYLTLAGLESKLSDAVSRRDKFVVETARADATASTTSNNRRDRDSARNSLVPLREKAKEIDSEIALLRMNIVHAKRMLSLAENHAASTKAGQAAERGEPARLIQLEIRAPDGRIIRQFHRSIDAARAALQSGYEITGQVVGSGVVSPLGAGTRSFMASLLDAHGDELEAWLEAPGIGPGKQPVVVLPNNGRELQ